jgi:hypothetical protein
MALKITDLMGVATQVYQPTSTSAGTITSSAIDLTGYDRVLVILNSGTNTATGTLDVKVQSSATSGGSYADVASYAFVQVTTSNHQKVYFLDGAVETSKNFWKIVHTVALAACVYSITVIPYNGNRLLPATQSTTNVVVG